MATSMRTHFRSYGFRENEFCLHIYIVSLCFSRFLALSLRPFQYGLTFICATDDHTHTSTQRRPRGHICFVFFSMCFHAKRFILRKCPSLMAKPHTEPCKLIFGQILYLNKKVRKKPQSLLIASLVLGPGSDGLGREWMTVHHTQLMYDVPPLIRVG